MMNSSTDTLNKFLFDVSFDDNAPIDEPPPPPPIVLTPDELEAIKAAMYQQGQHDEMARAAAAEQSREASQLDHIAAELQALGARMEKLTGHQREIIVTAVKAIAQNMLPVYLSKHGYDEMERLVVQCLTELKDEPRLVIRVCEAQLDQSIKQFEKLAAQTAFHGKLIILGDAQLSANDIRVEWADGGLERTMPTLWTEIEQIMSRAINNVGTPATTTSENTGEQS